MEYIIVRGRHSRKDTFAEAGAQSQFIRSKTNSELTFQVNVGVIQTESKSRGESGGR